MLLIMDVRWNLCRWGFLPMILLGILFDNVCLVHGMRIGSDDQTIVLMF